MELQLHNSSGAASLTVSDAAFGRDFNEALVHQVVTAYLAGGRAGTKAQKTRAQVSGGGKKPWRQKGTGRARAGTIRAAQFTGGGVVFPPTMRDFSVKVNKKALRAALRAALSDHAQAGTLGLVADGSFEAPSTKQAVELLQTWGQQAPTLLVANEDEVALIKSFRNLERVLVTVPAELEVAQVVWARSLVVSEAALPLIQAKAGVSA